MSKRIRVGIIGANPDRGWAAQAHIPALKSLSDDFEITALSTSRRESADAASKLFGVPLAFDNHQDLVNSPVVDVVAVTVKVQYHLELATAALDAAKAVYCEWPLGNGLKEAETLAEMAKKQGVLAVAGLQARSAPSVAYVNDLIKQGYVGEVLSTTLIGSGMGWGPRVEPYNVYTNDKKNGATMLSIALGHAADALCHCLGEVRELSATMTMRRKSFTVAGTGERKPMAADDQVAVSGLLDGGAAFSIHYRGGIARGANLPRGIHGPDRIFTLGFVLVGLATLAQASCLMLVNTSIGLLVVREFGLGPQVVGAVIGIQATCALVARFPVGAWSDRYGSRLFALGGAAI